MKKIIHHIRTRPDHIKSRYVIVLAALATVVVVAIWIVTNQLLKSGDDTIKAESPFSIVGSLVSESVSTTKETYQQQKQSVGQVIDITEETKSDMLAPDIPVLPDPDSSGAQ